MAVLAIALWLFVLLALLSSLRLVYVIWWRPKIIEKKLRNQGIHVLPCKLPHGNVKEINELASEAKSKPCPELTHDIAPRLDPLLQELSMAYKKPFAVCYGKIPTVIIMDPELIREILTRKFEFQKPEVGPTMKLFLKGLANIDGDKWVKHRKIINPAFHIEKLKGMLPFFMASCEEMVEKWDKLIDSAGSCELDVMPEFQNLTGDVISRAAFGSNLEEGRLLFSLQRKQGELLLRSLINLNSLWSRFLPSELNKRMMQIHQEIQSLLLGLIENREKAVLSGNENQNDLLNLLLKSNFNEVHQNKNIGMSREDMIEECKLFYFAGHETTANLLTWTMIVLSMHQNWQERARQEVLQLIGKNKPTFNDLNHLKTVKMILLEVLRLYPPTSLVRSIYKETKLGEYSLPAGVSLKVPLYLVQRDPELWGADATEFNPERFSNGITKAAKDFFAFGWGPRICIGQHFAMLEAKLALALILQHFSFELSSTYRHAPNVVLTLQPQFGGQIILRKI
ncbi:cytochrome P450 CYP72A219 [Ricinus communis]|uniref:Cytochrome P450, putative n=1 Tax=Ricinus communis TaxID=3988 RepID=B9RVU1_RICCO|nr:cytochrome P450 CYP72A219 [Ricinus communis]EEF44378.1 cytochrome P450, putative [Ricinus communis]|eukprot:XP_002517860.1 cytochrome P450 CYP72A219 [Ricinus communis]